MVPQPVQSSLNMSQVLDSQLNRQVHRLIVLVLAQIQWQRFSLLFLDINDRATVRVVNHRVLHRDTKTFGQMNGD